VKKPTLVLAAFALLAAPARADEAIQTGARRLGYSIGYQVGGDFHRNGLALDVESVLEGVRDALEATPPRLTPEEMRESLKQLQQASDAATAPGAGAAPVVRPRR
jgi:hypothetical protein